ncbi:hypothetical protein M1O18_04295, partial [Dehalococcoidia bacterium]|nr:hypothetical protein [Dehalococcoidia bacterium]
YIISWPEQCPDPPPPNRDQMDPQIRPVTDFSEAGGQGIEIYIPSQEHPWRRFNPMYLRRKKEVLV